jgi:hypothetical protein
MKGIRILGMLSGLALVAAVLSANAASARYHGVAKKFEDVVQIKLSKELVFATADAAKGVKIPFEIVVLEDWANVIPLPPGPSFNTPAGPSGLFPAIRIDGKDQLYSPLDYGLGAPPKEVSQTIKKGVYKGSFTWDGRNWTGPSDFGNPKGKPFPPGEYKITINSRGKVKADNAVRPYIIKGTAKLVLK